LGRVTLSLARDIPAQQAQALAALLDDG